MADIASIGAALSSIKTATELAKLVKGSNVSLEKAEIKLQLAELISALADAKMELAEVQDLLREKDQTIKELIDKNDLENSIIFDAPYYWIEKGALRDGPYCPTCYDDKKKTIRLVEKHTMSGSHHCHVCDSWFGECHMPSF